MTETESESSRPRRHIALVAHDNMKVQLLAWAEHNRTTLAAHHLYATGTTGTRARRTMSPMPVCSG